MIARDELTIRTEEVESILKSYLPKEEGLQSQIFSAMNYSVLAGGKRLRPIFLLEFFKLFSKEDESSGSQCVAKSLSSENLSESNMISASYSFAAAIEMIHTYSLVHDDLPAMDNDLFRRGKRTTHGVYGEAIGILAGDALLNFAFETAATAFKNEYLCLDEYRRIAKALEILSKKAGVYGMIGGQTVDIQESGKQISSEQLDFIYRLKTSALLEAAMMIGAVLAGAKEEEVRVVEHLATEIGMAFQIKDDILDVTSSQDILGKPIHSDEKNQKTTYVSLFGLQKAEQEVRRLSCHAIELLHTLKEKDGFLQELMLSLVDRDK